MIFAESPKALAAAWQEHLADELFARWLRK
jgi:hypothetical protein